MLKKISYLLRVLSKLFYMHLSIHRLRLKPAGTF